MKILYSVLIVSILCACSRNNVLTKIEKSDGFILMFDGKSTQGWRGAFMNEFPKKGWVIRDGALLGELSDGGEAADGGDIVSLKKYRNFDLRFDWKLGKLGNSGVKYLVEEKLPKATGGSQPGYEYQLIDDADFIYNDKHLPAEIKTGSLYQIAAAKKPDVDISTWHTSRIVFNNDQIEHYLDGKLIVSINRKSKAFMDGFQQSKFKSFLNYPTIQEGHILLQDHGHNVAFRNIKIKEL
ncbi:DUF1080 domain-containing protein [Cytophagaceae bacterium 50C-KIRBA]|uniref:DUF1080 domain-containing protein n=1 Tax=Aquirufa beregesia TaxID=2516556 RepID=A0ABX0EUR5_9BACT|nr:DUF1080 domain-containing protein [Aquirufa beregesia]NGZ43520.1 DUF1080 domain-containing protein [Aquirufa beregesia]